MIPHMDEWVGEIRPLTPAEREQREAQADEG